MQLAGKKALILGASRGIGLAIARLFSQEGATLALPWFDWPESVAALEHEFAHSGSSHLTLRVDLREDKEVAALAQALRERFGLLDILINNIERGGMPIVHGGYELAVNQAQWKRELDTTLHAKWLVWRHCFPLLQQAEEAVAVNISSIAALVGRAGPAGLLFSDGYAAANRGVRSLTETWARQGAPKIRVNELMLGLIDGRHGPGTRGWSELKAGDKSRLLNHTLLQRTGTAEEAAKAALFLARDASFLTGAVLRMDGGYVLGADQYASLPTGVLE